MLDARQYQRIVGWNAIDQRWLDRAAICKKNKTCKCHVGVDGAVFNKYRGFKSRASQALREIFDLAPDDLELIALNPSEDGSGVGAALAAVLALGGETKGRPSKIALIL